MRAVGVALALCALPAWAQTNWERTLVVDEVVSLPPGEWRFAPVAPPQGSVLVRSEFAVLSGSGAARVAILRQRDLERRLTLYEDDFLKASGFGRTGRLAIRLDRGAYAVVLEGREKARDTISVRLRVWLDPARRGRQLPPARRWTVVIASLAVFAAICVFAFWRLRSSMMPGRNQS